MLNWFRVALLAAAFCSPAIAQAQLAPVFSDHMVLQRDKPIAVWGTAGNAETLEVSIGEHTEHPVAGCKGPLVRAHAADAGWWTVRVAGQGIE